MSVTKKEYRKLREIIAGGPILSDSGFSEIYQGPKPVYSICTNDMNGKGSARCRSRRRDN